MLHLLQAMPKGAAKESYITHYNYLVRVAVLLAHHVLWHVDTYFTYIFSKLCDVT